MRQRQGGLRWGLVAGTLVLGALAAPGGAAAAATPSFSWSDPAPEEGVPIQFLAGALAGAASLRWDFGDGATSAEPSPVHVFQDAGVYSVRLVAETAAGPVEVARSIHVADALCGDRWSLRHEAPAAAARRAVAFAEGSAVGFAAGSGGLLRWDGLAWRAAAAPAHDWNDVALAGAASGLAVAEGGQVAAWDGAQWKAGFSPSLRLRAVELTAPGEGWAAGDALYRVTSNALAPVQPAPKGLVFEDVELASPTRGWLATPGGSFWTFDGASWKPGPAAPGPVADLEPDGDGVLAVGGGRIHRFDGAAWTTAELAVGEALTAVVVGPDGVAWASGERLWRRDGGAWTLVPVPDFARDLGALGVGDGALWAVGTEQALRVEGDVVQVLSVTSRALTRLALPPGERPLVADDAGAAHAWSGAMLETQAAVVPTAFTALGALANGDVLGADAAGGLWLRRDGAWSSLGAAPRVVRDIAAAPDGAWAVGDGGTILRWDGAAWRAVPSPTTRALHGVAASPTGEALAVGAYGTALRLAGDAWVLTSTGTSSTLRDVAFHGAQAFAVGDSKALRWTGTGWTSAWVASGTWRAVASSGTDAWAVGDTGRLARWSGASWTSFASPTARTLHDVAFAAPGVAYAVGDGGAVLRLLARPCFVADAQVPATAPEGLPVELRDASRPMDLDRVVAWSWSFGDGTTSSERDPVKSYAQQGWYSVRLTVTDDDGVARTVWKTLRVLDVSPTPVVAGPTAFDEGEAVTFDASGSTPGAAADPIRSYAWDVDADGTVEATGMTATLRFPHDGARRLALRVTDEDSTAIAVVDLAVADLVPAAAAGPDLEAREGEPVALSGAASVASAYDPISRWEWDLGGDGTWDLVGPAPTATFPDQGAWRVVLRVTDEDGDTAVDDLVATVLDAVPQAALRGPSAIDEGVVGRWDALGTVASSSDPVARFEWDLDADGAFDDAEGAIVEHAFPQQGFREIAVRVVDEDGSADVARTLVEVLDTGPTVALAAPGEAGEGRRYEAAVDVAAWDGVAEVAWDFEAQEGAFAADAFGASAAWTFDDAGTFDVAVRVTDGDGTVAEVRQAVVVAEAVPIARIRGPASATEGESVVFDGSASVGDDPVVRFEWDFHFDGTFDPEAVGAEPTVVFEDDGDVRVALRVTDDDGDDALAQLSLTILDLEPSVDLPPSLVVCVCTTVEVHANASAGDADPITLVEWDFDYDGTFEPEALGRSVNVTVSVETRLAVRVLDEDGSFAIDVVLLTPGCLPIVEPPAPASTTAGTPVELVFHVTNAADRARTLELSAAGPTGWALTPPPATLELGAGERAPVALETTPPETAEPGTRGLVTLAAQPGGCPSGLAAADGLVEVVATSPVLDAEPESQSATAQPGAALRFPFVVLNRGQATLEGLTAEVAAGPGWVSTPSVDAASVPGGGEVAAALDVQVPSVSPGSYPFTVRFASANGGWDEVEALVHVGNLAPVANAGPDRTVEAGAPVGLDGTASYDPNGDPLRYRWVQTSGPRVTLADGATPTPTFTAPPVTSTVRLQFRLDVTDPYSISGVDYVEVLILGRGTVGLTTSVVTKDTSPSVPVTYALRVTNGLRLEDTLTLAISSPPAGWTATLSADRVGPLAPGSAATVTLTVTPPPAEAAPYSSFPDPHRAVVVATATSVHWSDPRWAPVAPPTAAVTTTTRVPVLVEHVFAVENLGPLDSGVALSAGGPPWAAVYTDPFETVRFTLRARFLDGTPLAHAALAGTVAWAAGPGPSLLTVHAFEVTADADGLASVEVPLFLDATNLPGEHRVVTEARGWDHVGTSSVRYLVDPAGARSRAGV